MRRNLFFTVTGSVYLILAVLLSISVLKGVSWVTLTPDTAKTILSTLMSVSGSIIGFLVIYLSLALEGMKRNYGKHAVSIFRRDTSVWVLCYFFSIVIIIALFSFFYADQEGDFWIWSFNIACLSFGVGIALIVPFGRVILKRTDIAEHIGRMIHELRETDFREPPAKDSRLGTMYWVVTEDPDNRMDNLSNMLYHHINEGNGRLVTNIMIQLFKRIVVMVDGKKGKGIDKVILRYLDVLVVAFDYAKHKNDEVTIKLIFSGLNSCSDLIAKWRMGRELIEQQFEVIGNIVKHLLEEEREQLVEEAFWAYYHMAHPQVMHNLPPEDKTWEKDDEGEISVINTSEGWENEHKFDAVDSAMTFQLKGLVDRSFMCANTYITEHCVRMLGNFIDMLIFERGMAPFQKYHIGSMLSYESAECVKRFITRTDDRKIGFLILYVGDANIMTALEENSDFSKAVFEHFIEIFEFIIEEGRITKFDLDKVGGLGRLIIANSAKITAATDYTKALLEVNKKARASLIQEVKTGGVSPKRESALKELIVEVQKDLKSFLKIYYKRVGNNPVFEDLIKSYQS